MELLRQLLEDLEIFLVHIYEAEDVMSALRKHYRQERQEKINEKYK